MDSRSIRGRETGKVQITKTLESWQL